MKHLDHLIHSLRAPAGILGCLVALAAIALTGCGGSGAAPVTGSFATAYAGNWSGTWTDIDGTSGTSTMVITADTATNIATVNISLSGAKFGFAGAQTALTGSFDANAITVASPAGQTAMATLVIDKSGQFTGTVTGLAAANVSSISFSGPSTSQSVTLTVVVHHKDGTTDTGTVLLTKQSA